MNRIRQNIITIFLITAMLFTGNFAFALTPVNCEMECCLESNCCGTDENSNSKAIEITGNDNCCDQNIEQAVEQDHALLLMVKSSDKLKYELLKTNLNTQSEYRHDYTHLITHKLKTSNIYLLVSNFRI